jgi:hypothetical protein
MNRQNQQNTLMQPIHPTQPIHPMQPIRPTQPTQPTQPVNILFYSKQCKSCNIFINQCHKHNILKYFKLVCVDERINEFKEKGIKIVPTIYKQNHGIPL